VSHLHTDSSVVERSVVAQALHDGPIQSLIALEMRLQLLGRQLRTGRSVDLRTELADLAATVRKETIALRELMTRFRPIVVLPEELLDHLDIEARRFEHETGIRTSLTVAVERVTLDAQACNTVARVAREALANVRKHAGARTVRLHLGQRGRRWNLIVDDDGKGFSHAIAVGHPASTPRVLRDCADALGGALWLGTSPHGGARVSVSFTTSETTEYAGPCARDQATAQPRDSARPSMSLVPRLAHKGR
jgi:two-component system nitrate/nitrite sensor histidine kinase NarX